MFKIGDRVHHTRNGLYGIIVSEEFVSGSGRTPSYKVDPEEPEGKWREVSRGETWWKQFLVAAPLTTTKPLPKSDYPHKHEVCGSPAFVGFMSVDCTKCGKSGM